MESINLSNLNLVHWGLLAFFALAAIYLLIKAAAIVHTYDFSKDRQRKVQISILVGFYGAGFWFCCILAILTVLWANLGLRSAVYVSLIIGGCTLPVMFIVCTVGAFIQLNWTDRIKGVSHAIGEQEIKRRNG
jgi:hypothetical protein